jgi:hypothetical protein
MSVSPSEYKSDPIAIRPDSLPYVRRLLDLACHDKSLADGYTMKTRAVLTPEGARWRCYLGPIGDGNPIVKAECVAALRQELLGYGKPDPDDPEDEGMTLDDIKKDVMSDCSDGNFVGCDLFKELAQHIEPDTHFFVNCTSWGGGDYFWVLYYDSYGNSDEDSGREGSGDSGNWYRARQVIAERQGLAQS